MNKLGYVLVVCAVAFLMNAAGDDETEKKEPTLGLTLTLSDGSLVIGVPRIDSIRIQTSYAKMDIPLKQIRNIKIEGNHETASLTLTNGDKLTGILKPKLIELETIFGKAAVDLKHISGISVCRNGKGPLPGILKEGLVLYYPFDKDEDDQITDTGGQGHHGNVHGATWVAEGALGGCYEFNGRGDYISVPYSANNGLHPVNTPFTVCAWFKTAASSPSHQTIVATHYAGMGSDGYFFCVDTLYNDANLLWFRGGVPRASNPTSVSPVDDGQWHHAVGLWNGTQTVLYVDGVWQASNSDPNPISYSYQADFRIGHMENNNASWALDTQYYFKGKIDEVRVYDRAITASEVKNLYDERL